MSNEIDEAYRQIDEFGSCWREFKERVRVLAEQKPDDAYLLQFPITIDGRHIGILNYNAVTGEGTLEGEILARTVTTYGAYQDPI